MHAYMNTGLSTEQKMEWLAQKKQEFKEKEIKKKQDQVKQSEKVCMAAWGSLGG